MILSSFLPLMWPTIRILRGVLSSRRRQTARSYRRWRSWTISSNNPIKCLAKTSAYTAKLRKNENEAREKATNEANRSDIKEKIRAAMEQQRIESEQRRIAKEQERIAKEKQPSKAELRKLSLEREWKAKLVGCKILNNQMCSCLMSWMCSCLVSLLFRRS